MLIVGQKKKPQRIVLREAVPPTAAVRRGRKIVVPATDGEPEAFVVMAPITAGMRRRAARATRRLLGDAPDFDELDVDQLIDASEAGARELIRLGILDWGGIGLSADEELAPTPDRETRLATANEPERPTGSIDLLLDNEDIVDRLGREYVRPDALARAEKNVSSASPNGTGEAATRAGTIAASAAVSTVVARKAKRTAATRVRTASTRSGAKPAKGSGTR